MGFWKTFIKAGINGEKMRYATEHQWALCLTVAMVAGSIVGPELSVCMLCLVAISYPVRMMQ